MGLANGLVGSLAMTGFGSIVLGFFIEGKTASEASRSPFFFFFFLL